MNKSILALAALAGAISSVPAFAEPVTTSVRIADLDLDSAAGRETLARRISSAAKRICDASGDPRLAAIIESNRCYDRAVNSTQYHVASAAGGVALASK